MTETDRSSGSKFEKREKAHLSGSTEKLVFEIWWFDGIFLLEMRGRGLSTLQEKQREKAKSGFRGLKCRECKSFK